MQQIILFKKYKYNKAQSQLIENVRVTVSNTHQNKIAVNPPGMQTLLHAHKRSKKNSW
jgi:hypothetical protein